MSNEPRVSQYEVSVVALYHFFLLFDRECTADLSESFTNASVEDRLTVNDCIAAVHTVSSGTSDVKVRVALADARPTEMFDRWDHVTELSLDIVSGSLMIESSLYESALTIPLPPGPYRLRIHHGDLSAIIAAYYARDYSVSEDVWITVWPERYASPTVLKRYPQPGAQH